MTCAARSGPSVYELPPGRAVSPYHYEDPEETSEGDDDIVVSRSSGVDVTAPWSTGEAAS